MNTPITPDAWDNYARPIPSQGEIPILYEDEDDDEMGKANLHVLAVQIFRVCISAFLRKHRPQSHAFADMNLYYRDGPHHPRTGSAPYVSPDVMVVEPSEPLPEDTISYTIGKDGSAPILTIEVMSPLVNPHWDFIQKNVLYRKLRVAEYLLFDITKKHSSAELLLRRLGKDGEFHNSRDGDGGVTSDFGVRFVIEDDGLRVVNAKTGSRYVRPHEAEDVAEAMRFAVERQRAAEKRPHAAEEQARLEIAQDELKALKDRVRQLEVELKRRDSNS